MKKDTLFKIALVFAALAICAAILMIVLFKTYQDPILQNATVMLR